MASTYGVTVRRLHFKFEIRHLDLKFFGLVLIFLAEARRKAQHELHALDFVQPIGQRGVQFVFLRGDNAGGTHRTQPRAGQGAVAIDCAVACRRAQFVVFGKKLDHRDSAAGVDAQLRRQFAFLGALDEAQIDFGGIGFGYAVDQRALLYAIAAPDAAEDQDFHFADEAGEEVLLGFGQVRGVVDLRPAALLLFGAGLQGTGVREGRREFFREIGSVWHDRRIIHCLGTPISRLAGLGSQGAKK